MAGTDGKPVEDGTQEVASSEGSSSDNGKQSSITGADTAAQLKALQDRVDALTRSLQSEKDKGIAKTNKRLDSLEGSLKEVLQQAAKSGKSTQDLLNDLEADEEAQARQAMLEMAQAFRTGKFPTGGGGSAPQNGVDVSSVIRELELDPEDIRVKAFVAKGFASEAEAYREGAKLVKSITSKQPSEADLPSDVAKGRPNATQQEALLKEYEQKSANLRGNALVALKMQYRKKGLRNIY